MLLPTAYHNPARDVCRHILRRYIKSPTRGDQSLRSKTAYSRRRYYIVASMINILHVIAGLALASVGVAARQVGVGADVLHAVENTIDSITGVEASHSALEVGGGYDSSSAASVRLGARPGRAPGHCSIRFGISWRKKGRD